MNYTSRQLLDDFDIYNKIIPSIDKTITTYGKSKLRELFNILYYGKNPLVRRNKLLTTILHNPFYTKRIINTLIKIKKLENNITWLYSNHPEYDDLYLNNNSMNIQELLSCHNTLKSYMIPLMIIIYIIIFIILNYNNGFDILNYIKNIYEGYKSYIQNILESVSGGSNNNMISVFVNILVKMYIFYKLYVLYNMYQMSVKHRRKCKELKNNVAKIRKIIDCAKYIYKNDVFLLQEKAMIWPTIKELDNIFASNKINNIGHSLILVKNKHKYEAKINAVLGYIGLIDSFISIASLITENNYILPTYDFNDNNGPYIKIIDDSSEILLKNPTTNITMSTSMMKNIILAVLLCQTIGVSYYDIKFTPFTYLFSKWNFDGKDVYDILKKIPKNQYFCAILNKEYGDIKLDNGLIKSI